VPRAGVLIQLRSINNNIELNKGKANVRASHQCPLTALWHTGVALISDTQVWRSDLSHTSVVLISVTHRRGAQIWHTGVALIFVLLSWDDTALTNSIVDAVLWRFSDLPSPSRLYTPVPNYTARLQRHEDVKNLHKIVAQQCTTESNLPPLGAILAAPPRHIKPNKIIT